MLQSVNVDHPNFRAELEFKSKKLLVETIDSGTGKTFIFNIVQNYVRVNHTDIVLHVFDYSNIDLFRSNLSSIVKDSANLVLIDNLEILLDEQSERDINNAKCQIIMFGRDNKNIELGRLNIAKLKTDSNKIYLHYPYLEG